MNQEHLDQVVTDALLARISQPHFTTPVILRDEAHRDERDALRLEVKALRIALSAAREDGEHASDALPEHGPNSRDTPEVRAIRRRIDDLQMRDPLIAQLRLAGQFANLTWRWLTIVQRRHVVESLVVPRVNPVEPAERGRQGVNEHRIELVWR